MSFKSLGRILDTMQRASQAGQQPAAAPAAEDQQPPPGPSGAAAAAAAPAAPAAAQQQGAGGVASLRTQEARLQDTALMYRTLSGIIAECAAEEGDA